MISTRLTGGLGNNLFCYAFGRIIAERHKLKLCYFPPRSTTIGYRLQKFFKRQTRSALDRARIKSINISPIVDNSSLQFINPKQVAKVDLAKYFQLGQGNFSLSNNLFRFWWAINVVFRNRSVERSPGFNGQWLSVSDWAEITPPSTFAGLQQSRPKIITWYKLRPKYQKQLDRIDRSLPVPPSHRCCIHIRRTDYLWHDKGYAYADQGWVLPPDYYWHVISQLPKNLHYVVVTDDAHYATGLLQNLKSKTVMHNNPDPIDMFCFTLCRYNIIANSTFSMWGAWLNDLPGKKVWAPRYNIGWSKKTWMPNELGWDLMDWNFVDVAELLSGTTSCLGAK